MLWHVTFASRARKEAKKLPKNVKILLDTLSLEIEKEGPYRKDWPNYSPLKKGPRIPDASHHCHLKKGHPTYVACWQIVDKDLKRVEMFYVGTHEDAPY